MIRMVGTSKVEGPNGGSRFVGWYVGPDGRHHSTHPVTVRAFARRLAEIQYRAAWGLR